MKVTLITGASGGIGEAFARRLAKEKHHLVLVARSEDKLRKLCDELMRDHNINAQYVVLDLVQPGAAHLLYNEVLQRNLEVDCLINNAGIGTAGDFSQIPLKSELDMITLNVSSLVAITHLFLQPMRMRMSGTIVNVSSLASFQPCPFMAAYAASKVFVRSFTEAIAEENRPFNIRIMLLCPGATETSFFDTAKINADDKKSLVGNALETPEMVVETAMAGLRKGKRIVVSGFKNVFLARAGYLIPNSVITRIMGRQLRPYFQKQQVNPAS